MFLFCRNSFDIKINLRWTFNDESFKIFYKHKKDHLSVKRNKFSFHHTYLDQTQHSLDGPLTNNHLRFFINTRRTIYQFKQPCFPFTASLWTKLITCKMDHLTTNHVRFSINTRGTIYQF